MTFPYFLRKHVNDEPFALIPTVSPDFPTHLIFLSYARANARTVLSVRADADNCQSVGRGYKNPSPVDIPRQRCWAGGMLKGLGFVPCQSINWYRCVHRIPIDN